MVSVRVMALNVWGMPAKVGSEDKELRIKVGLNIFFSGYFQNIRNIFNT